MESPPAVAIFGPHPLLTVTVEDRNAADDLHLHAGGQGVWVSRMAGELGAHPILCGFAGGETGQVLRPLLDRLPGECRLVDTTAASGSYVVDRRYGQRRLVAHVAGGAPTRHELDDLFSVTCAAALESEVLVVCNPYPGDTLPLEIYGNLVADARANGTPVVVDLSTPRLDSALEGRPNVVKINDWELAEYVVGPVSEPEQMLAAASRIVDAGAETVVITRAAEPILVFDGREASEIVPPRFDRGSREGCGDSMAGALAASLARGMALPDALRVGAAAGAANFLRHGLGTGSRQVVEDLVERVQMRALPTPASGTRAPA